MLDGSILRLRNAGLADTSMVSPIGEVKSDYDDAGQQIRRTLPNGAKTEDSYNAIGLPTNLLSQKGIAPF